MPVVAGGADLDTIRRDIPVRESDCKDPRSQCMTALTEEEIDVFLGAVSGKNDETNKKMANIVNRIINKGINTSVVDKKDFDKIVADGINKEPQNE